MAKIRFKRHTAADWVGVQGDPVLEDGEPGFIRDTGQVVIGDGVSPFSALTPLGGGGGGDPGHASDTTDIHGITDTADLLTQAQAAGLYMPLSGGQALTLSPGYRDVPGDTKTILTTVWSVDADIMAGDGGAIPTVEEDFVSLFRCLILAKKANGDTVKAWRLEGVVSNVGGASRVVGSTTKTVMAQDPSAGSWDTSVAVVNGQIQLTVSAGPSTVNVASVELSELLT